VGQTPFMETELKLLVAPAEVARFRGLALLRQRAVGKPVTRALRDVYFDTPEHHLKDQGLALRVRRVGAGFIQTLKRIGQVPSQGLYQRGQWEVPIDGAVPQPQLLIALAGPDSVCGKLLADLGPGQVLEPVFQTQMRRTVWRLQLQPGTEVEVALDRGQLSNGFECEPVSEVELELKSGGPAAVLFDLALELLEHLPLRIGRSSKAERGYALGAPELAAAVAAGPLELKAGSSVEEGFQVIAAHCLAQIQANAAGVELGHDPECVHQMRVGIRRLRCALRLFEPWVRAPQPLLDELSWLRGELGAARDADVLAEATLPGLIRACPGQAALPVLEQVAAATAAARRAQAAQAVISVRYARLVLGLAGWLACAGRHEGLDERVLAARAEPLRRQARKILAHRHRTLMRRGKGLAHATFAQCHQLRIAAKMARYASEFFLSLYPSGAAQRSLRRYLERLAMLQDGLGGLNDAAVADRLLGQLQADQPQCSDGASFARGYLCAASRHDLSQMARRWKRFGAQPPH
jgi:triphosphatase